MPIEYLEERGTKTIIVGCSVFLGLCLLVAGGIAWWQAERVAALGVEAFRAQCGYTGMGPLVVNESFNATPWFNASKIHCWVEE